MVKVTMLLATMMRQGIVRSGFELDGIFMRAGRWNGAVAFCSRSTFGRREEDFPLYS